MSYAVFGAIIKILISLTEAMTMINHTPISVKTVLIVAMYMKVRLVVITNLVNQCKTYQGEKQFIRLLKKFERVAYCERIKKKYSKKKSNFSWQKKMKKILFVRNTERYSKQVYVLNKAKIWEYLIGESIS